MTPLGPTGAGECLTRNAQRLSPNPPSLKLRRTSAQRLTLNDPRAGAINVSNPTETYVGRYDRLPCLALAGEGETTEEERRAHDATVVLRGIGDELAIA